MALGAILTTDSAEASVPTRVPARKRKLLQAVDELAANEPSAPIELEPTGKWQVLQQLLESGRNIEFVRQLSETELSAAEVETRRKVLNADCIEATIRRCLQGTAEDQDTLDATMRLARQDADYEVALATYIALLGCLPSAVSVEDYFNILLLVDEVNGIRRSAELDSEWLLGYLEGFAAGATAGATLEELRHPDMLYICNRWFDLARSISNPRRLVLSYHSILECLLAQKHPDKVLSTLSLLSKDAREGCISREQQLDVLEGLKSYIPPRSSNIDTNGLRSALIRHCQDMIRFEHHRAIGDRALMRPFIHDVFFMLLWLNPEAHDEISAELERERTGYTSRDFPLSTELTEDEPQIDLSTMRIVFVGGREDVTQQLLTNLKEKHKLRDCERIPPSKEAHYDSGTVRDKIRNGDLIVVVKRCIDHSLSNLVQQPKEAGSITGHVLWAESKGMSGIVREIRHALAPAP